MSKYSNIDEPEAGDPHYKEKKEEQPLPQGLLEIDEDEEPEAGKPHYVPPKEEPTEAEQAAANDELNKPFNAKEEYDKLMESIRKPRSHQAKVEQAGKDKKFRETISALSLLLNTAKGAMGGTIRKEDYSGITAAANEAKAYQAMEDKDTDRYEDAKSKLWMDLYNLQLKDKAAYRSYKQELEKILFKEDADARNIGRRDKATKEQILLRGDVDLEKEDFAQKGRMNLQDKKHGQNMELEAFKQKGREQLASLRVTLKQSGDINKPFIDVKSPYGKGSVGLTKGEALEFFDWLLGNGDITENDYTLMFEALNGTAANNMVQSKVVSYVTRYPQPLRSILSNRGKAEAAPSKDYNPASANNTSYQTDYSDPFEDR